MFNSRHALVTCRTFCIKLDQGQRDAREGPVNGERGVCLGQHQVQRSLHSKELINKPHQTPQIPPSASNTSIQALNRPIAPSYST